MKLEEIRKNINEVDDQIAKLYVERMALSKNVAEAKKENCIMLENTLREKDIINRVTKNMPSEIKLYAKQVYNNLFNTSKAYQQQFLDLNSVTKNKIQKAIKARQKFPVEAVVACQGIAGAYSSLATEKMFELSNIMYLKNFDAVFSAVENGLCEYGVLPIENSSVGSVNAVYDLMQKHNFYIVKSCKLKIQHCLLSKSNVKLENIKEIISHEQAIGQCSDFLKNLKDIKITYCDNTAMAAKLVAETDRDDIACISSKECAGIYGLDVIKSNLQNNDNNYTRFITISKHMKVFNDANKISIMVHLPHTAGSLNNLLDKFNTLNLNLTKLESRPIGNTSFEFAFYFDFEANIEDRNVLNLLAELENSCESFTFLGNYKEI